MSVLSRLLRRDADDQLVDRADASPAPRRRDGIEQVSYPKPWTRNVFQSELELARGGERYYLVARAAGAVVGYGGLMFVVDDAHVTNIAVAADTAAHRRRHPPAGRRWRGRRSIAAAWR